MPSHHVDRAAVVAIAVLQIVTMDMSAFEPDKVLIELERYLRDEFADLEQQIAADREAPDA